jgi:flagellar biosynthesis/type III secretory pathway M-ring protein FliF/YscJ
VVILDGIVVILSFILNPIAKRRRAKEAGDAEVAVGGVEEEETAIHSTAPNHHFAKPFDTRSTYESDMTETEEEREEREEREAKALSPPHTGIGRTASKDRA